MIGDGQGGGPASVPALSGLGVPNRHKEPKGNVCRNKTLGNHGCCKLKELQCLEAKEGADDQRQLSLLLFTFSKLLLNVMRRLNPVLTAGRIRRAAESIPDGRDSVSSMIL